LAAVRGGEFSPGAVDTILDRLGWHVPYYLDRIADRALGAQSCSSPVSSAQASAAVDALLDLSHRPHWTTWREHLDKNFSDPERTRLFAILAAASSSVEGTTLDSLRLSLFKGEPVDDCTLGADLDTLEQDGYLTTNGGSSRFRFRMELLRLWWQRYVVGRHLQGGTDG
jgi:hypothetical protein